MAKISAVDKLAALFSAQRKAANDLRSDIDDIESEIVALRNELGRVRQAPVDGNTIRRRVEALIASSVATAEEAFGFDGLSVDDFSASQVLFSQYPLSREASLGLIAMLGDKEAIRDILVARYSPSGTTGISDNDRERETKRLEDAIAERERVLERIHREAEAFDVSIPRRADADPAALLMPDEE